MIYRVLNWVVECLQCLSGSLAVLLLQQQNHIRAFTLPEASFVQHVLSRQQHHHLTIFFVFIADLIVMVVKMSALIIVFRFASRVLPIWITDCWETLQG